MTLPTKAERLTIKIARIVDMLTLPLAVLSDTILWYCRISVRLDPNFSVPFGVINIALFSFHVLVYIFKYSYNLSKVVEYAHPSKMVMKRAQ